MTLDQIKKEAAIYFGEYATSIFPMDAAKFAKHCVDKAQQWRPIEEAPKDGTRVLLYWPKFGSNPRQEIGYFEMQKYHSKPTPYWWSSNAVKNYGLRWYRDYQPTHWQPLPPAPEEV